jgi:YihY family inner membrane protein
MKWVDRAFGAADRWQRRWPVTAFPVAVWKKFSDDQAGNLAALISYYGFLAVFPLLLIFVTVLDMTLKNNPDLRRDLLDSALAQYPVIGNEIGTKLGTVSATGLPLGIGILVLLFGTRGVAMAMQTALCQVWGIPRERRPGFPWSILYALGLVLTIGLGFVVTSFLSFLVGGAGHLLTGFGAQVGAVAISLVLNIGVFWLAFRIATMRKVRWRDLRIGAALAALVWQVLQVAGGYVVTHQLHRASALYGTFGIVLGLLGWLYLQAQFTLYCAEVDVVLTRRQWPRSLLTPPVPPPRTPPETPPESPPQAPRPALEPQAQPQPRHAGKQPQRVDEETGKAV